MVSDIITNLAIVRKNIAVAAEKNGRSLEDVILVCVTKQIPIDIVLQAVNCGATIIGENRVSEVLVKKQQLPESISWHMIGHLQTRKVKEAVKLFDLIHSVDSVKLANEIDKRAAAISKKQDVLLEVNISGEESKYGFSIQQLEQSIREIAKLSQLQILGLMTMAPFVSNPELTRPVFRKLRELQEQILALHIPGVEMKYLSMGMSQDYEIAVEEGSNMVRIGSAIFTGG